MTDDRWIRVSREQRDDLDWNKTFVAEKARAELVDAYDQADEMGTDTSAMASSLNTAIDALRRIANHDDIACYDAGCGWPSEWARDALARLGAEP